jgi:hypothetical protein
VYPVLLTSEKLYGVDVWVAHGWFKFQVQRPQHLSAQGRQFFVYAAYLSSCDEIGTPCAGTVG